MQRPGRNDACPCGSGKKYKRCCLGKEEQREQFARELDAFALPLLRDLGQFAARRANTSPEKIAAERFPFWRPPMNSMQGSRLLDYLIFDYHPDKYGVSAASEYAAERSSLLPSQSQFILQQWINVSTQLYVLSSWSAGFAACRPATDEGAAVVDVMPLEREGPLIAPGRPVALRALPVGHAFVYPSWPITFGSRSAADVLGSVQARHHTFARRERIVSFEDFLKLEPTAFDEEAAVDMSAPRIIIPGR